MRIARLPGVFRPRSDSWLLASVLRRQDRVQGGDVLDVCTGSGLIAVTAALAGARSVCAVDVSLRAVLTTRLNARLNCVHVEALRGDMLDAVPGRRFDVVAANPPYLPSEEDGLPARGTARHTEAGGSGRVLLDRLIADAAGHLRPGGLLLVTHSSVIGEEETLDRMRAAGLEPAVAERRSGTLGPLLAERARELEAKGMLAPGERREDVLVLVGSLTG
ncbi:MAG: methyltransferase [Solirubrobacterales bacterium]|nr:methyltransferase [Solirubrobacterales bacterium]